MLLTIFNLFKGVRMKKYILYMSLLAVTLILSITIYKLNTFQAADEIKRLANENYNLKSQIMTMRMKANNQCKNVVELEAKIESLKFDLYKMSELQDFEHYKIVKSHTLNPETLEFTHHSAKFKNESKNEDLKMIINKIEDESSFDDFIQSLAQEQLIVIDHLTRAMVKFLKEEGRSDEFLAYIHKFRAGLTVEESYILSRLKYMLMS